MAAVQQGKTQTYGGFETTIRYANPETLRAEGKLDSTNQKKMMVAHTMNVLNGRDLYATGDEEPDLQTSRDLLYTKGFCLARLKSAVEEQIPLIWNPPAYRSPEFVKSPEPPESEHAREVLFRECEELVTRLTGADYCYVITYGCRTGVSGKEAKGNEYLMAYANFAHCDYTHYFGAEGRGERMLLERGVPEDELKDGKMGVAFFNIWMPRGHEVEQYPLGMLDWSSMDPAQDMHALELNYQISFKGKNTGNRQKHSYVNHCAHNDAHRWFYFPRQRTDEALVFTQLDMRHADEALRPGGFAKHCFHTAVQDTSDAVPKNPVRRSSVEIRVICGYKRPAGLAPPPPEMPLGNFPPEDDAGGSPAKL